MPYTASGKNTMLDSLGISHVSLHTADPGQTGASEVSGAPYARAAITFDAATGGAKDSAQDVQIGVPAGTTITHVGYWSAATGGTFLAFDAMTTPEEFSNQGTATVSVSLGIQD